LLVKTFYQVAGRWSIRWWLSVETSHQSVIALQELEIGVLLAERRLLGLAGVLVELACTSRRAGGKAMVARWFPE
jgi:hypothetical protein